MALLYNIGIEIAELAYVFFILILMNHLAGAGIVSQKTGRKLIHLWWGGLIPFWFLFDSRYAQWLFVIPILISIALLLYSTFVKGKHNKRMARFTRGDTKEALFGPLIFMLVFVFFTFVAFKAFGGVAALCAMTFGDGLAPIAGRYAKHKYFNGKKSIEGSLAMFIGTLFSIFIMFIVLFPNLNYSLLFVAIVAALAATIVEALTPSRYDNLTVALAAWIVFLVV